MPSLRDLDIVHRLNAPTRAAATRRRRLRKLAAAACLALACFIAFGGSPASPAGGGDAGTGAGRRAAPDLAGRSLVAIPSNDELTAAIGAGARADVWAPGGERFVACAPVPPPSDSSSSHGSSWAPTRTGASVLVALTPSQVRTIARHLERTEGDWTRLFLTICS